MIKDYQEQLNTFFEEETRQQTESYFKKYWLDKNEYVEKWLTIQDSIFNSEAKHLPDMMFNNNFELFPLVGGNIFTTEKDFTLLQNCISQTGDKYFTIVQNKNVVIEVYYGENNYRVHPFLRFKYPVNVSWDEMMSGGFVSSELFQSCYKDYFVFGDSGTWGRYVANDYVQPTNNLGSNPLNIMGFKKEYSKVFRKNFEPLRLLEPEITPEILFSEWLPDSYKQYVTK
jgi:hypothetical protein